MRKAGKRVFEELYVHMSALDTLEDQFQGSIREAILGMDLPVELRPNAVKINLRTRRFSLLTYRAFDSAPFPELLASWVFSCTESPAPMHRYYGDSANPPILHRKELLVKDDYPNRSQWVRLTECAEELGLFDDTTIIGFKESWDRLIKQKGLRLENAAFFPLGNVETDLGSEATNGRQVYRHLTALTRAELSAPVQTLIRHGLLSTGSTFFDYGCGKGDDVRLLRSKGFNAQGWDPHYFMSVPIQLSDVVNLGFVINVIDDPDERAQTLASAFQTSRKALAVSTMLIGSNPSGTCFRDGFITSRSTFQRYFTQSELKSYVEEILQREAFMVAPGIAFVFPDAGTEEQFCASRYRSRGLAARLLTQGSSATSRGERKKAIARPRLPLPRTPRSDQTPRALLERIWEKCLDLGRYPEEDEIEVPDGDKRLDRRLFQKALRELARECDQSLLIKAALARSDEVKLFFAESHFSQRSGHRRLDQRLRRDARSFFGTIAAAQAAGLQLLRDAANPECLYNACKEAAASGLGWLDGQRSLQIHASLVEKLPAVIRAYFACGMKLWGDATDVHVVKFHIATGKLTLLQFDDFDNEAIPLLRLRIKINVRRQSCEMFYYGSSEYPPSALYFKSRLLQPDHPDRTAQAALENSLEKLGLIGQDGSGPKREDLDRVLEEKRLALDGAQLIRSRRIPALDEPCGAHLTYRAFIECGATRNRLGLQNIPLNPDTYNAIFELATMLVDPIIDYFGGIELTYGVCTRELSGKIIRGVAHKLDQHCSHEFGRSGKLICERGGAAVDVLVRDEDMLGVARWIASNLPFDRIYYYGFDRPIHVSYSHAQSREAYSMIESKSGRLLPRRVDLLMSQWPRSTTGG